MWISILAVAIFWLYRKAAQNSDVNDGNAVTPVTG
jgi:hypothetical protein